MPLGEGAGRRLAPPDLADLLELMEPEARIKLIATLGVDFPYEALSELDETVRDQLLRGAAEGPAGRAVAELETDDAAYVLENLEEADKQEILAQMPAGDRAALERNLEYPEETAGRLMQTDFVAVPPFWTVGQVIDHMREAEDLPETFSDIFVVDPTYHVRRQRRPEPAAAHQARGAGREDHGRGPRRSCWRPPTRRRWRASSSATT